MGNCLSRKYTTPSQTASPPDEPPRLVAEVDASAIGDEGPSEPPVVEENPKWNQDVSQSQRQKLRSFKQKQQQNDNPSSPKRRGTLASLFPRSEQHSPNINLRQQRPRRDQAAATLSSPLADAQQPAASRVSLAPLAVSSNQSSLDVDVDRTSTVPSSSTNNQSAPAAATSSTNNQPSAPAAATATSSNNEVVSSNLSSTPMDVDHTSAVPSSSTNNQPSAPAAATYTRLLFDMGKYAAAYNNKNPIPLPTIPSIFMGNEYNRELDKQVATFPSAKLFQDIQQDGLLIGSKKCEFTWVSPSTLAVNPSTPRVQVYGNFCPEYGDHYTNGVLSSTQGSSLPNVNDSTYTVYDMWSSSYTYNYGIPPQEADAIARQDILWTDALSLTGPKNWSSNKKNRKNYLAVRSKVDDNSVALLRDTTNVATGILFGLALGANATDFVNVNIGQLIPDGRIIEFPQVTSVPHPCTLTGYSKQPPARHAVMLALNINIIQANLLGVDPPTMSLNVVRRIVHSRLLSQYDSSPALVWVACYEGIAIFWGDSRKNIMSIIRDLEVPLYDFPYLKDLLGDGGQRVSVEWRGLVVRVEDMLTFDFGSVATSHGNLGVMGVRQGEKLDKFKSIKSTSDVRRALLLVMTSDPEEVLSSSTTNWVVVCGATHAELKSDVGAGGAGGEYLRPFHRLLRTVVFPTLIFDSGDAGSRYGTPLSAFNNKAMVIERTYGTAREVEDVLTMDPLVFERAKSSVPFKKWSASIHIHSATLDVAQSKWVASSYLGHITSLNQLQPVLNNGQTNVNYTTFSSENEVIAFNRDKDVARLNKALGKKNLKLNTHSNWVNARGAEKTIGAGHYVWHECRTRGPTGSATFIFAGAKLKIEGEESYGDSDDELDVFSD